MDASARARRGICENDPIVSPFTPCRDLVEDAAGGEVLLLRELPAAEVLDGHEFDLRELAGIFRGDRGVARPVEILRGDFLAFGRVQELQVRLRRRRGCRGAAPPCRPRPPTVPRAR